MVVQRGSESESGRYSLREIVFCRCGVDFNGGQSQPSRFLPQNFREHSIPFEQVGQSSFGVPGAGEKSPRRSATILDHGLAELRRWQEPDGLTGFGEKRFDEMWQQSKTFDEHAAVTRELQEIFDDQVETFTLKPVKRLKHRLRRSLHPSLVEIHVHERM